MDTACASNTSDAPARDASDGMLSTRGHRRPEACARASVRPTTVLACAVVLLSLLNGARGDYKPDLSTIPTPPVFVHDTVADKLYFQVNSVHEQHDQHHIDYPKDDLHMRCRARAIPEPTYRWQRLIEMDASTQAQCEMMSSTSSRHCWARYDPTEYSSRIYPVAGEGTMHVSMPTQSDEGVYRCLAANGNGTAIDKPINLTMAWIHRFHDKGPESYEVELGNPFDRMCEPPPSNPPPTVYWIFKSEEDRYDQGKADFQSINSTRISGDNSGHLYFHYVTKDDYVPNKYYTCTAWNPETNEYKFGQQFQIIVTTNVRKSLTQVAPTQQKTSKDVETAIKGSMHYLYCFFAGLPEPRPVWYKDGREIMGNDDQYKRISWGKALLIVNVTADDEGVYECRFDRAQALDRSFRVEVEAAPYFPNGPPASRNESEGSTVHFECGAMGKPAPEFKFFKNGVPLHNGNGVSISANRLTLTNIQKPDMNGLDGDNGVYQCEATNKHGTVWTNFYLNILSFRPILLRAPSVVNAVMQSDVTLECEFFGSPTPTVTWKRLDGQPMSVYEEEPIDGNNVAKLHIRGVSDSSSGSYECFASNVHGEARGELRLRVLRATRIVGQSASTTKLRNQTRIAGQSVHLPCKVEHDDNLPLRIEWLSDGRPLPQQHIESGHLHILHDNTLVIRESRRYDTGSYTCVASTDLDKAERTFTLTIKEDPYAPKVEIVAVGDDHFNVTRIPGPYDPNDERPSGTTGFFKYREKGDGDDAWVVVHPRDEELLSTSVKGLSPGTQYEVVAVSRVTLDDGTQREKPSLPAYVKTAGQSATAMVWWWLIVLILLICLLICILCVVCACVRSRGANYPVSEKERDQGREPMLKADDKHFGEYGQAPGGERASLASKAESDVDSMADYGDGDAGKFTEDGSFIGQYTQNKLYVTAPTLPADAKPGAPSTFV